VKWNKKVIQKRKRKEMNHGYRRGKREFIKKIARNREINKGKKSLVVKNKFGKKCEKRTQDCVKKHTFLH